LTWAAPFQSGLYFFKCPQHVSHRARRIHFQSLRQKRSDLNLGIAEGIVYLPGQAVSVTGNAEELSPSPYTSYIADTLRFAGNAQLIINNDTTKTAVPIPKALYGQTNGTLAMTK
jgi:hypothetical protein